MGLPSIIHIRRRNPSEQASDSSAGKISSLSPAQTEKAEDRPYVSSPTEPTTPGSGTTTGAGGLTKTQLKRGTRVRRGFALSASFAYLLSFIFLVLVLIGNTYPRPVLSEIYFFKLDLADIIPTSVPNASLINSIAQSIGLHDFYQVGLWNFCEGYQGGVGITFCSRPQTLYWFNPVEILMSELLSGATIALPTQVVTILDVLRITSNIMFGFFLTACVLCFVMVFVSPLATSSRWASLPLALFACIASTLVGAACIVGSVISFAFKYAATAQSDLNIRAYVGVRMFVFMWLAAGFAFYGFVVHAGMGCCCVSKRDLRTGRKQVRVPRKGREDQQRQVLEGTT
ncbi:SUR7 family protein pun1 [Echria macrotheca]|uniref:SUR7 family protein pun1 n=1 Tax=Echria macrotheca TaxID=438768 RepID=A0AAJ0BB85_9PEZI|nr:SUR7 family protein pun1 [Echria macrotheca]